MKLHEIMAQLKEDGSNWIFREADKYWSERRLYIKNSIIHCEFKDALSDWNQTSFSIMPLDNWQLRQEPKFKEGDLVRVLVRERKGMFAVISDIRIECENIIYTLAATDETHWDINYFEEELMLIMSAEQLANIKEETNE